MKNIVKYLAPFAAITLSACGGSGSSNPDTLQDPATTGSGSLSQLGEPTLTEVNGVLDDLIDVQDGRVAPALSVGAVSTRGSASFDGHLLATVTGTDTIIVGRTKINANFSNGGSLNGNADDFIGFIDIPNPPDGNFDGLPTDTELYSVGGSLALSDGSVSTGAQGIGIINVDLEGDLTIPSELSTNGSAQTFTVDGDIIAQLRTDNTLGGGGIYSARGADGSVNGFVVLNAE